MQTEPKTETFDWKDRINVYTCKSGHQTVTIDRETGVTPFAISCRVCNKMATSSFYRVPEGLTPTHEWYKPTPDELTEEIAAGVAQIPADIDHYTERVQGYTNGLKSHVEMGGLMLREIKQGEAA